MEEFVLPQYAESLPVILLVLDVHIFVLLLRVLVFAGRAVAPVASGGRGSAAPLEEWAVSCPVPRPCRVTVVSYEADGHHHRHTGMRTPLEYTPGSPHSDVVSMCHEYMLSVSSLLTHMYIQRSSLVCVCQRSGCGCGGLQAAQSACDGCVCMLAIHRLIPIANSKWRPRLTHPHHAGLASYRATVRSAIWKQLHSFSDPEQHTTSDLPWYGSKFHNKFGS